MLKRFYVAMLMLSIPTLLAAAAPAGAPLPHVLSAGWSLQDVAKVPEPGARVSSAHFKTKGWYAATVPGTVLATLVNNRVYPEPLYGENNRPETIPDSLCRTSYWYRTEVKIPKEYRGQHIWLNFDGINYSSAIWVNGTQVGVTRGAFIRGKFDISANVRPGKKAVIAVLVAPQPHPGEPHEHTLRAGMGLNGGITAIAIISVRRRKRIVAYWVVGSSIAAITASTLNHSRTLSTSQKKAVGAYTAYVPCPSSYP